MTLPNYSFPQPKPIMIENPDEVEKHILSFLEYQDGWADDDGTRFYDAVIRSVLRIYKEFKDDAFKILAFPQVDGGVSLSFYRGDICLDVEVAHNLFINLMQEQGKGKDFEVTMTLEHATYKDVAFHLNKIKHAS